MHQTALACIIVLIASSLAACASPGGRPDPAQAGILFRSLTCDGQELKYALYVPPSYSPATPIPAILFLHGKGECGTDGERQIAQGLGTHLLRNPERWPCIVIMPQKPDPEKQWEAYDPAVMAILARTRAEYAIDPARIALTGLSQGGHGTWTLGAAHPEVWSTLVPICGYADPAVPADLAAKIKRIPIWCFHGEADDTVPIEKSRAMMTALNAAGAKALFTAYPGIEHESWHKAYDEPALAPWMLTPNRQ